METIKCPKCGRGNINISTWFRIVRGWFQTEEDGPPDFFDYEDFDYYPDSDTIDFSCEDCRHQWSIKQDINDLLDV